MKRTIYIVIQDCANDFDRTLLVEPFGSLDEAAARFKELTDTHRSDAKNSEWMIEEDTPTHFSAYEEGYECQNHYMIALQISDIIIK